LSALAGGTVYYVPATLSVPIFNNVAEALSDSLGLADISVVVCDGKANPADVASCLAQAVDASASAVITHGIPSEMAPVAFESVTAAGIPLLITQIQPAGPGDPKMVDSNATATVLVIKVTDNDATAMWTDVGALAVYEQACPDCTVDVIETNTGQLDKLPSLVSARLVANPDITYVQAPFDLTVQPVVQGIQTAGRDDVQVVSMDGGLSVMQDLAAGKLVSSEVGFDSRALGWYAADQVLRMMTGMESVQNFSFPLRRLFTTESASTLSLTPEAEASGEWYGEADYQAGLLTLWGLN
jgi:ribose transport system substrate-binding protein